MIHRAVLGLAVTTCLVACLGRTTSLGGPEGTQSSATSTPHDGGSAAPASTSVPSDSDAGSEDAAVDPSLLCAWYSWKPEESSVACEYLIPAGNPASGVPAFDPFFSRPYPPQLNTMFIVPAGDANWHDGTYVATGDECGGAYGFHYDVDPVSTGQMPTRIVLCPASCDDVHNGQDVRLMAVWSCGPQWGPQH
ncbi:MAG: hypothetical protein JWP87_4817 [Labilithrix sp.]|nr:hypothetical protein [Labilithrix sp.]